MLVPMALPPDDARAQVDQIPEQSQEKQEDDAVEEDAGERGEAQTGLNAVAVTNVD